MAEKGVRIMDYMWFVFLSLGVMFLMYRGRGGMGCCGGGHGDHHSETSEHDHSSNRASRDPKKDVIDLREDEYTIITPKRQGVLPREGAEHSEAKA
jgi:hypothetical protein